VGEGKRIKGGLRGRIRSQGAGQRLGPVDLPEFRTSYIDNRKGGPERNGQ
jgi:hypothetical protein